MISIVVPTYNDGPRLAWALASLVAQTETDWECIVVDDGSNRPAQSVVDAFADDRIRIITHPENRGRGIARMTGIAAARGDLLAMQDADDWSAPGRLRAQREALSKHGDAAFVFTGVWHMRQGAPVNSGRTQADGPRTLEPVEDLPIHTPTMLLQTDVLKEVPFRSRLRYGEDVAFLIPALTRFRFMNLPDLLYSWEASEAQTVRKYIAANLTLIGIHTRVSGRQHMGRTSARVLKLATGILGYPVLAAVGQAERWVARPLGLPDADVSAAFTSARSQIESLIPPQLLDSSPAS